VLVVPIVRKDGSLVLAFVLTPKVVGRLAAGEPQLAQAAQLESTLGAMDPFLPKRPLGAVDIVLHFEQDEDEFLGFVLAHPDGEDTLKRIAAAHRHHASDQGQSIPNLLSLLRSAITEVKQ